MAGIEYMGVEVWRFVLPLPFGLSLQITVMRKD